ncbi:hypothetical protein [Aquincola sp. J276]|uniref:hypothetical protein n=1 Tax=Aquincola sp. J276 TaxID=2898432 RepID=UPI002150914F|nr:hypothetical protein [Aquincola sp. J276]MCR5867254.1 hypothetical protein [Aquincola sp. J276]
MAGPEPLARLRDEALARWTTRLADPDAPPAELLGLQQRLQMLDAALAALAARQRPRARRWGAAGWPVLLVATVLLLAATVPVRSVPLSLSLQAGSVTLQLPQAVQLELPAQAGPVRAEGFTQLQSGDAALEDLARQAGADRLRIEATELRLRSLQLPAGSRLTLQAAGGQLLLQVEAPVPPVVAELQWRGQTRLQLGDLVQARPQADTEWLRLQAGDAARPSPAPPPLLLALPAAGQWLRGLRPESLRFAERVDGGAAGAAVGSSLHEGLVQLPATGGQHRLAAGDWLELDGLAVERLALQATGSGLAMTASGSATGLRTRVGDFEQSLKPSLLEMVARHHLVGLLWSAAAMLWGALAWTRRQLTGAAA